MQNEIHLILSLLVMVAATELTTDAVAGAVQQTASFINTTPLLPSRDRHPLTIIRLHNYALSSKAEITGELQRSAPARHFVCDKGYTLKQCDWHMGRESLLDFAIRHELGHALCNNANEMDADRVARLLEQKKPISCKARSEPTRTSNR